MLVEGEGDVYRCGHEHAATRTAALAAEYLARRGSSAPSSRGRAVVEIHDFARKSQLLGWLGDLDSNQDCSVQSREFYR